MNTITPAFRPAKLRTLEISYMCDLGRTDGKVIPLGVMSDLLVRGVYGLGLVARESLTTTEMEAVGRLIREDLKSPFHYLVPVFEEVYNSTLSAEAFVELPKRHALSLCFRPLKNEDVEVPRSVIVNGEARRLWAKDELSSHCNKAFWTLFGEHVPEVIDKSVMDEARALAA
jgi:hypothetical protein